MTPTDPLHVVIVPGVFALAMLAAAAVIGEVDERTERMAVSRGPLWWASFALTWLLLMADRRPRLAAPPLHGRTPSGRGF